MQVRGQVQWFGPHKRGQESAPVVATLIFCITWCLGVAQPSGPSFEKSSEEIVYTPHLVSNIVPPPAAVFPSAHWATIFGIYEVETNDWEAMKVRLTRRLAVSLENISPEYLELVYIQKLAEGVRCSANVLACENLGLYQTIRDANPRYCTGVGDLSDKYVPQEEWMPPAWTDNDDLEMMVWNTPFCISERNTSILKYPYILNNTFITGARNRENTRLYSTAAMNLTLHIVGVIPVVWAKFFNAKFQMDGSIPLPERQPEVIDEDATHTADLNISIRVFGVRDLKIEGAKPPYQLGTYMKTCPQPSLKVKGCYRIDHKFYEHPRMTYYKLKYRVL